jgi:hypothetical protein
MRAKPTAVVALLGRRSKTMRRYDVLEQPDGTYTAIGSETSYRFAGFRWAWHSKPGFVTMLFLAITTAAAILFVFSILQPATAFGFTPAENRAFGLILAVAFLAGALVYFESRVNAWRKKALLETGWAVVAERVAADTPDEAILKARPRMVYDDPMIHKALDLRDSGQLDAAKAMFERLIAEDHADERVIGFAKRQLMVLQRHSAA